MRKFSHFMLGLTALVFSSSAFSGEVPMELKGGKIVSPQEAKALIDKGGIAVDTRPKARFNEEHLPGAIVVPYDDVSKKEVKFDATVDKFALDKLPKEKSTALIFYCDGLDCWKSYKASLAAIRAGFPVEK